MLIYVPPGGGLLSAHLAAAAVPPGQSWCSSSPQFLQRERDVDSEFVVVFFSLCFSETRACLQEPGIRDAEQL